uniref:Succinyl-diaminopimelate desuccinylase n=1 Tax=uncultured bacterium contig00018 TaxID=1181509 RepID=A0A806KFF1_9BACT|nr:succinyl-diaminopimelate desuccinylase [uncultured bacterium contig00018]
MKEKIFAYIDSSEALAVELETELCKRPAFSPDSGGEGELNKCEFLAGWLKAQGITQLERFDAPDPRAKGGVRPSLVATIPGRDDASPNAARFWVMSHIDVVPPGEASLWKSDPWKVIVDEGGRRGDGTLLGKRVIGRGVEDNQQGLISSVLAALALIRQGITPSRTVKLLFAADEECGSGYGLVWILKNHPELFRKSDLVLIPDSGDEDGSAIEIAEKSHVWVKFTTKGVQAHASTPDLGVNAYLAAADLTVRLHYGLSEKFADRDALFSPDYSTFQPTKKEPNVPNVNTIPGEDAFYYDMRILPRHPVDEVFREVDRIKAEVEKKHGVAIEYSVGVRNESPPTSKDSPLVAFLAKNVEEVYGVKTKPVGIGGGTFAAFLRREGIDCAVWARIDHTAHQPNEYALLDNILGDAKVMALMMVSQKNGRSAF